MYDLRPRLAWPKQQNSQNQIKKSPQEQVLPNQSENKTKQLPVRKIFAENKEVSTSFSLESELIKIKVPIPLLELLKNPTYK